MSLSNHPVRGHHLGQTLFLALRLVLLLALLTHTALPALRSVHAAASKALDLQRENALLVLENNQLRLELYGQGRLSLADANGRRLLFPGATSYLSLWIDGQVYAAAKENMPPSEPRRVNDLLAEEVFQSPGEAEFRVQYQLEGPALRLAVRASNLSSQALRLQARWLLDTQVDLNDGSPLWHQSRVYTQEASLAMPFDQFKSYDQIPEPRFISTGLFQSTPSQVQFVHWPTAVSKAWDYIADPNRSFYTPGQTQSPESDSAVLVYYDFGQIQPQSTNEAVMFYGTAAPEAASAKLALLLELERARQAALSKLDADITYLVDIETTAYQIVRSKHTPGGKVINAVVNVGDWGTGLADLVQANAPGALFAMQKVVEYWLNSLDADTENRLKNMMVGVFEDIDLKPDDAGLKQKVREVILDDLDVTGRKQALNTAFDRARTWLETQELPPNYPYDEVIRLLKIYRSQLDLATKGESALIWPDPDKGTLAFQGSGVLAGYLEQSKKWPEAQREGFKLQTGGFAVGATAVAGGLAKLAFHVGTAGWGLLAEAFLVTVGSAGFMVSTTGKAMEITVDRVAAYFASTSALAAVQEEILLLESASDLAETITRSLDQRANWQGQGRVTAARFPDITLQGDEGIGKATAEISIDNQANQPLPTVVFGLAYGKVAGGGRPPVTVLGITQPVLVSAGNQHKIDFDFTAPGVSQLRIADAYTIDLWAAVGYHLIHANQDPGLAPSLQFAVYKAEAAGINQRQVSVVHAETLAEGQSSQGQFTVNGLTGSTTLQLSYLGSEMDLHLYDSQGRHVGLNYQTGAIETQIPGVEYSGAAERPEWMRIPGYPGETFRTQVVGVQLDDPEDFVVTSIQVPALPALLYSPDLMLHPDEDEVAAGQLRGRLYLSEYGGSIGASGLQTAASALRSERGLEIPASAVNLTMPERVSAGQTVTGEIIVRAAFGSLAPGSYSGAITVRGQAEPGGQPLLLAIPFTVVIGSPGTGPGPVIPPPPPEPGDVSGGGGLGIALILLVAGASAVGLYVLRNQQNRFPRRVVAGGRTGASSPAGRIRLGPAELVTPDGRHHLLHTDYFLIGRGYDCDLQLNNPAVSRRHAILRQAQGRWYIQDASSKGGLLHNGQPVRAAALNPGDAIQIGPFVLYFY